MLLGIEVLASISAGYLFRHSFNNIEDDDNDATECVDGDADVVEAVMVEVAMVVDAYQWVCP